MIGRKASDRPGSRTEPTLGDLDHLDSEDGLPRISAERASRRAPPSRQTRRRALWPWLLLILAVVGGIWVWIHQDSLRADLPRTELNTLLSRADTALAAGHLDGHNGDSARELYESARALAPDNDHALEGLTRVGQAELERARKALAAQDFDQAADALRSARALLGGGSRIDALDARLKQARNKGTQIDALVSSARSAQAADKLEGKDGAAALYRKVLDADLDNAVARHGLDQVGDAMAVRIKQALDKHDLNQASALLARLARWLPNDAALPALRASVSQARSDAQAMVEKQLAQGKAYLRAGQFTGHGQHNALAQFRAVLAADPGNSEASHALGQVAQALIVQANAAIEDSRPQQAKALLDQAAGLAPKSADLAAARSRLRELDEQLQIAADRPQLSAAQHAHVRQLVSQGDAAASTGKLMLPPGDSAYDRYRAALAIDPDDHAAMAGLAALPRQARRLFADALGGGNLQRAGNLLATLEQLSPGDNSTRALRRRLAEAWLDRADQRLEEARWGDARRATEQVRRLTPDDPRLDALEQRIAQGGG